MKIETNDSEVNYNKEIKFPVLAKALGQEHIVMFTSKTKGIVLNGTKVYKVGHFCSDWVNIEDKDVWYILPKNYKVIFTQE